MRIPILAVLLAISTLDGCSSDPTEEPQTENLREEESMVSLPQLAYDVAYFVLPQYAFGNLDKIVDMWTETPNVAGPFLYVMACKMQEVEPVDDDVRKFRAHHGQLDSSRRYYLLEYPVPAPVDMSDMSIEQLTDTADPPVLAPHFSAIIHDTETNEVAYFILGQAPLGGGTTFRSISPEGINSNLGPGPAPEMDAFLDIIRNQLDGSPS